MKQLILFMGPKYFSYLVNQCLVCDRTSTISYSMFFKAILKFLVFLETNLKFWLVIVSFLMDCKNFS